MAIDRAADRSSPDRMDLERNESRQALRLDSITGRYDPVLGVLAIVIAALGLVMVGSSSME